MATKKTDMLVINPDYLKKAGIELDTSKNAAATARAAIIADNGGKGYVPQNAGSDTVIQIMDYARRQIQEGENARKQVCVALASVDLSKGYEQAQDVNGKPYTSMLSFAMDVLPSLAKSTVAGLLAVGRNIYVPAIQKRFGVSSSVLLELPPSTLEALKANLANDATRANTIEVLKEGTKNNGHVTQALAKKIAYVVREREKLTNKPAMTAKELLKAAKGDTEQLKKVLGETETKPSGTTKNGGNAESAEYANNDEYNAIKAKLREYVKPNTNEFGIAIALTHESKSGLCGFLRKVMVDKDGKSANLVCRALAEILEA